MQPLHELAISRYLCSTILDEVQRAICSVLAGLPRSAAPARLLDVGCWDGESTLRYGQAVHAGSLAGIEPFTEPAAEAEERGIEVARIDLERTAFPWPRDSFDVIVANQVFEHLKNIWLPLSEIHRVLKPGGAFVISVPNLASLHNRLTLALGRQPTSVRTLSPHVRGYTLTELTHLIGLGGAFNVERRLGVGFYPLPGIWARPVARLWPNGSHTSLVVARKTDDREIAPWLEYRSQAESQGEQTFYGT